MLSTAVVLSGLLVAIRAHVVGVEVVSDPLAGIAKALLAAHRDLLVVAALTLCSVGAHGAIRNQRARRVLRLGYGAAAFALLLAALVNVEAVRVLGGAVTYPWLYYSDFLGAPATRLSVLSSLSWKQDAVFVGAAALLAVGTLLLKGPLCRALERRWVLWTAATGGALYLLASGWYLRERAQWSQGRVESPVLAFAASVLAEDTPPIFTMDTPVGPDDFLPSAGPTPRTAGGGTSPVRNVVLFVLESVAAQYTTPYGGEHAVTPVLEGHSATSMRFENVYSHVPSSAKSVVSLLGSRYPMISYLTATRERPDVEMPTLSNVLHRQGYRTGFFFSADTRYQGIEDFLAPRSFDIVQDYRTRSCAQAPLSNEGTEFSDGSDDLCTAREVAEWVRSDPSAPFFAVMWTMMTHYPYFTDGEPVTYDLQGRSDWEVEYYTRYLNALRQGDAALGLVLRALDEAGLADSTLVVVVGDHGEAFGQHDQYGHGSNVYEENVHVPLVLIHPTLFTGEVNSRVGGLVDLAPTVLDLIGLPPPDGWQGRSLLRDTGRTRTYFFSTYKEHVFGYREGDLKYLYNATQNRTEVYDLASDPGEQTNLADSTPGVDERVQHRLAAWVQYQRALWDRRIDAAVGMGSREQIRPPQGSTDTLVFSTSPPAQPTPPSRPSTSDGAGPASTMAASIVSSEAPDW